MLRVIAQPEPQLRSLYRLEWHATVGSSVTVGAIVDGDCTDDVVLVLEGLLGCLEGTSSLCRPSRFAIIAVLVPLSLSRELL